MKVCSWRNDGQRCVELFDGEGSRCPAHRQPRRDPATRTRNSSKWKRTSRRILNEWRELHGDWCPGDRHHDAHPSTDLTVDHLDELQATAGVDTGRYTVACRSANSARRDRA